GDRLVHRRHRRHVRTQALPGRGVGVADVEGDDVRARRHAGDAARVAQHVDVAAIARRGRGHVAAVAVAVAETRLLEDVDRTAGVAGRGADEVVAADELGVAAALVDATGRAAAEVVA